MQNLTELIELNTAVKAEYILICAHRIDFCTPGHIYYVCPIRESVLSMNLQLAVNMYQL